MPLELVSGEENVTASRNGKQQQRQSSGDGVVNRALHRSESDAYKTLTNHV